MSLITEVIQLFKDNDVAIKVIAMIAAPGGLWFYVDKFKNRIQIKLRKLDFPMGDASLRGIEFQVENISTVLTSVEPQFELIGYSSERKKQTYKFRFDSNQDRQLPPHVPKYFLAWHNNPENRTLHFLWFMTFEIPLSRGRTIRIRVRNADLKPVSWVRFHWERIMFIRFGKVPG